MFQRYSPWGTDCDQGQPVDPHHLPAFVPPRLVGKAVSFGVNKESYRYDSSSLILTLSILEVVLRSPKFKIVSAHRWRWSILSQP